MVKKVALEGPPHRLESQYFRIFTNGAKEFLYELISKFDAKVDQILLERERRRIDIAQGKWKPTFQKTNEPDWKIDEIPTRIRNRKLDLGDISPASGDIFNTILFTRIQCYNVAKCYKLCNFPSVLVNKVSTKSS